MLGERVRAALEARGIASVAAPGFQAPGVVVSHTPEPTVQSGKAFIDAGLQIANGVPLKVCVCLCARAYAGVEYIQMKRARAMRAI